MWRTNGLTPITACGIIDGMARQYHRYTTEEVATALAVLQVNGGNLQKTETETGISRPLLRKWLKESQIQIPPKQSSEDKAAEISTKLQATLHDFSSLFARIACLYGEQAIRPEVIAETKGPAAVLAAANAYDKHRLCENQPTSISQTNTKAGEPDWSKMTVEELRVIRDARKRLADGDGAVAGRIRPEQAVG